MVLQLKYTCHKPTAISSSFTSYLLRIKFFFYNIRIGVYLLPNIDHARSRFNIFLCKRMLAEKIVHECVSFS